MNIKYVVIVAVIGLLGFIGFNSYKSAQYRKAINERQAETANIIAQSTPKTITKAPTKALVAEQDAPIAVASTDTGTELLPIDTQKPANNIDSSVCTSVIKLAENTMYGRQHEVPIAKSLSVAESLKDGTAANDAVSAIAKQMVIDAYNLPYFSTPEYKERAIREFGSNQYLACVKAFS